MNNAKPIFPAGLPVVDLDIEDTGFRRVTLLINGARILTPIGSYDEPAAHDLAAAVAEGVRHGAGVNPICAYLAPAEADTPHVSRFTFQP